MISSTISSLLRLASWSFMPDFLTHQLLTYTHIYVFPLLSLPLPPPNSPIYFSQKRMAYTLIIALFLIYSLYSTYQSTPLSFYQLLGVSAGAGENELRGAFRQFAKVNHPDRLGPSAEGGEEMFRRVREVYEALRDPVKRWAYDRFGEDVLLWNHCTTPREYMRMGLMQSSGYYIVTVLGLVFFGAVGKKSPVAFWRNLIFLLLLSTELSLILHPSPTPAPSSSQSFEPAPPAPHLKHATPYSILYTLFPNLVPFQHVLFLHQLFMVISVGMSRVVPRFLEQGGMDGTDVKMVEQAVGGVVGLVGVVERGVTQLLTTDLHSVNPLSSHSQMNETNALETPFTNLPPLKPSAQVTETIDTLTKEMEDMIIEGNLRREVGRGGPVGRVLGELFARRQSGDSLEDLQEKDEGRRSSRLGSPVPASGVFGVPPPSHEMPWRLHTPRLSASPPPQMPGMMPLMPGLSRRGSSYTRARSVSY